MRAQSWSQATIDTRVGLVVRLSQLTSVAPEALGADEVMRFLSTGAFGHSSRRTYHANLTSWFAWLRSTGVRDDNPMEELRRPRAKRTVRTIPTTAQVRQLLESPRVYQRTQWMMRLAAYQGLRASEIARFHDDHVDEAARQVVVLGKGGRVDYLPLHPVVAGIVADRQALGLYGYWFPQRGSNREDAGHVLGSSVTQIVAAAMQRAGVPGSCHSLRHWHATELLRQGVDLRVIQQLMRHASLATTEIYLHVDDTERRDALLRLPDMTSRPAGDDA